MIKNSDLPQVKIRILNFVRTNNGYGADQISKALSIPLSVMHVAIAELQRDGLLQPGPNLKIGRRMG